VADSASEDSVAGPADGRAPAPGSGQHGGTTVRYEQREDIALITLDRPHRLNAVTPELVEDLVAALEQATRDDVGAAILRGAGRAFCAGHDLKHDDVRPESEERRRLEHVQDVTRKIRQAPFAVIAAVHGYALGAGCEFALCADLVIAADTAVFGFPEVSVGLGITGGISHVLPTTVGLAKAKELVLLGEHFPAAVAAELNLVNFVVGEDHLRERAWALACTLRDRPRRALCLAKQSLDRGAEAGIDAAYAREVAGALALHGGEDARRASEAFRRRSADRAARFTDRAARSPGRTTQR
jgi:2-(1,2-epoxy-1,2-dihydrophenyl)acetyl-CoA isomerase